MELKKINFQFEFGMTMIEVLIALTITAIALLAASQAMNAVTNGVARQRQVLLAQVCAENNLIETQFGKLQAGEINSICYQMNQEFQVTTFISSTLNPSFMRVQAQVSQDDETILSTVSLLRRR